MIRSLLARATRYCYSLLCFAVMLVSLASCSFFGVGATTTSAPPPVWTNYQGSAFTMRYFSSWGVAAKDLYLGTRYPELEMLQGTIFTGTDASTTFLQVVHAVHPQHAASARDIMLTCLLGASNRPAPASSLSTTALAGENWYQESLEKQVNQSDGTTVSVRETVFGIDHPLGAGKTQSYLIIYQDLTGTYPKTTRTFFYTMLKSFHFAA